MIGRLVSFAGSGQWEDLGLDVPQPDNLDKAKMLVATNVARKMALDMRLLGCKFKDDADNKVSICARTIYDYYIRSMVIGVHSSCSATLVHTNRTNGTYIPTSKKSWYGSVFLLMKYSLSNAPLPRGQEKSCLKK